MDLKKKYWFLTILFFLIIVSLTGSVLFYFWQQLTIEAQTGVRESFQEHFDIIFLGGLFTIIFFLLIHNEIFHNYIIPLYKLNEKATLVTTYNPGHQLEIRGSKEVVQLSQRINEAANIIMELNNKLSAKGSTDFDSKEEKRTLAAVIAEFPQGIIVCNQMGEIVLYNKQAQEMFTPCEYQDQYSSLSSCFIGLGRSIKTLIHPTIIDQAYNELSRRIENKSELLDYKFFIPEINDKFLKAEMVAIRDNQGKMSGSFLIINDLYQLYNFDRQAPYPEQALRDHINMSWPSEPIQLDQLLKQITISASSQLLPYISLSLPSTTLYTKGEIASLRYAFNFLFTLLYQEGGLESIDCQLFHVDSTITIVLSWQGKTILKNNIQDWLKIPLLTIGKDCPLRLRDIFCLNQASIRSKSDQSSEAVSQVEISFAEYRHSFAIASADSASISEVPPQIYDFELFLNPCPRTEIGNLPLPEAPYTVLDLETTGLEPDKGDEIISISAVRIVNNHILDEETFQHLINPRRSIPETSIQIHGIEPELLHEQPGIEEVLPLFHKFAKDTVLVAHCAYFDTCFIRKKEINAGLSFDHLILDTYALSNIVFPHQKDHRLEAIARRLNVPILGRHTAFGDALATAEILLKLIPLLMKRGITTPKQACQACQKQSPLLKSWPKKHKSNHS